MKKQLMTAVVLGCILPAMLAFGVGLAVGRETPPPEASISEAPSRPTEAALPSMGSDYDQRTVVSVELDGGSREEMELGQYLTRVLLAEMPAEFEPEALKAQAVVARTYTCRRLAGKKHGMAAVCTDPSCCQGCRREADYLEAGGRAEAVEKIRQAVRDTDGQVLTYEGALIDATYFSCSGGFTEDAVAVWGQDVPYLQAVESPGEEMAPRFREEVCFTRQELTEKLGLSGQEGEALAIGPIRRTEGGGIETVQIGGRQFSGRELRQKLGLRSTALEIRQEGAQFVFESRGFGHRVGMSQYGAQAMALEGRGYAEILSHYYQGTELEVRR